MRRIWLALALILFASPALADKRVALVVGNAAYQHSSKLANTLNDARGMRDALQKLGFTVVYGEDLNQRDLNRKIRDFSEAAEGADVALTYFAGHGSTFGGIPYVVPVDAEFASLAEVTYQLVPVETYIAQLRQVRGIRIAILDACRDNEAEKALKRTASRSAGGESTGLTGINPSGLIVAYSTQFQATASDGDGGHSPFTAAILQNIATPGLDVTELFREVGREVRTKTKGEQTPEIAISLFEKYYLGGQGKLAALSAPTREKLLQDPKQAADECRRRVPPVNVLASFFARERGLSAIFGRTAPANAVEVCEQAVSADPDNNELATKLAQVYWHTKQGDKAYGLAKKAADRGSADAMCVLALAKLDEVYVAEDDVKKIAATEAFDWFEKASAKGNDGGTLGVGISYVFGMGVATDEKHGARIVTDRANAGNGPAMLLLFIGHSFGRGVPQDGKAALAWLQRAVDAGYPPAMALFADTLQTGDPRAGIAKDEARAVSLYREAAQRGDIRAMRRLARAYELGLGVRKSSLDAADWYRRAIAAGGPQAATEIASTFERGDDGLPRDLNRAIDFYEQAADVGDAQALVTLATLHTDKDTAMHDEAAATTLYQRAANGGDVGSMLILGGRSLAGVGASRSKRNAEEWFFKASEAGGLDAMRSVARLYDSGRYYDNRDDYGRIGVSIDDASIDKAQAIEWYLRIVERSKKAHDRTELADLYAANNPLGRNDTSLRNDTEANDWYRKAADLGDVDAMLNLGARLTQGIGSRQNQSAGRSWFQRAAEGGGANAMYRIGELYRDGHQIFSGGSSVDDFPKDRTQAARWFKKAADGGNEQAAKALKELEQSR